MPQRTPTNSFSAFWASLTRARLSRPEAEEGVEGEGQSAFDRGRRGHARPDGDVAAEDAADAADAVPGLDELVEDPLEIVGPAVGGAVELAELAAEFLVEVAGDEVAEPVGPGRDGKDDDLVGGAGKDEAFVVVGVLADEVDPAGRDDEEGLPGKMPAESFGDDGDERVHDLSFRPEFITRGKRRGRGLRRRSSSSGGSRPPSAPPGRRPPGRTSRPGRPGPGSPRRAGPSGT